MYSTSAVRLGRVMFSHFQQWGKPQDCQQQSYNFLGKIDHPTNSTQHRTLKEADMSPAGHKISRLLYGQSFSAAFIQGIDKRKE